MMTMTILRVALPTPLRRLFDYLPPQDIDYKLLKPGVRLLVPFRNKERVGLLIGQEKTSELPLEKLKRAIAVLDEQPVLTEDVYKLCHWAAEYYHHSLGEVLNSALPVSLRKNKPAKIKNKIETTRAVQLPLSLNAAQEYAVQAISASKNQFQVFLLDGVTGSGKTEVYLHVIAETLKLNKQVLMLVPEISLTPQTIERVQARFSVPVVVLHSALSEQKRLYAWYCAKEGSAKIIIGTRSAIFTSFANLGLILVDEEHDNSFKQQDRFRYHARDLAVMRAYYNNISIILGSATPSLESLQNVKRKRYTLLTLSERPGQARLPQYEIIDVRKSVMEEGLSQTLLNMMKEHLQQDNQVMLFLNRRGFAPVLYCAQCAAMIECKRCDARMVYHRSIERMQCHQCDARRTVPLHCEKCGEKTLKPVGIGTQRLEQILQTHFPDVPIIRVDRDTTQKKNAMKNLLEQIHAQPKAILIGTQMLAKGHHFPQVTLAGIVDLDAGLFSADFRAAEQMGQLLMQAAGRAGRVNKQGVAAIQTRHPDHPLLQLLIQKNYQAFAQSLLIEREAAVLPPFSYFAVFRAEAYKEKNVSDFLMLVKEMLPSCTDSFAILGPVPALIAKRKGLYCQHLLLKTQKRNVLQQTIKTILTQLEKLAAKCAVKWVVDVDPLEV